jgi:hypothetical protein
MAINISPNAGMAVGAVQAGVGAIMLCGGNFTTIFGEGISAKIIAGAGIVFVFCGAVTSFISAAGNSKPGPLATPDPASVVHAQIAFEEKTDYAKSVDLAAGAAMAKDPTPPKPPTP